MIRGVNMEEILMLLQFLGWFCVLGFIAGMIRPVYVLWFMARCNRLLVLKYYGLPAVICWLAYQIISYHI